MKPARLFQIYAVVLTVGVFLNSYFPQEVARIIESVFASSSDLLDHPFIRYRMALWMTGLATFIVLLPYICLKGITGLTRQHIDTLHWRHILVLSLTVPMFLIGFPVVSLLSKGWMERDGFVYVLAIFAFPAVQIASQSVFLKLFSKKEEL